MIFFLLWTIIINLISTNPCTRDVSIFQITDFRNRNTSDFGSYDCSSMSGMLCEPIGNSSTTGLKVQLKIVKNQDYIRIKTYNDSEKAFFDASKYDFIRIKARAPIVFFKMKIALAVPLVDSICNGIYKYFPIYTSSYYFVETNDTKVQEINVLWKLNEDFEANAWKMCEIQITLEDEKAYLKAVETPVLFESVSFVNIESTCNSLLDSKQESSAFVRRNGSVLLLGKSRFQFLGFYHLEILKLTDLELDDLFRTISELSRDSNAVLAIQPLVSCATESFAPDYDRDDCILIRNRPREYKESILLKFDFILAFAKAYNVKILFYLMEQVVRLDSFSFNRNIFDSNAFFVNPLIIDDFKHLVSYILNRNNTKTGTMYMNDPTIFGWSLAYLREFAYYAPPNLGSETLPAT